MQVNRIPVHSFNCYCYYCNELFTRQLQIYGPRSCIYSSAVCIISRVPIIITFIYRYTVKIHALLG